MIPEAGLFSLPVNISPVSDDEDDKGLIFSITNDAIVAHAETVLADMQADERFRELQRIGLRAVPVELLDDASLHVPREVLQRAQCAGCEDVLHAASELQ